MLTRKMVKLVGGILLAGVGMLVLLTACGGAVPAPSPTQAAKTFQQQALPAAISTAAPASAPPAAASLPAPNNKPSSDLLAKGKLIYEKTAGGVGCASCHGLDGKGTTKVGAPDIRGKIEAQVRAALAGGVAMMSSIKLNDEEIAAVVAYLQYLNGQP